MERKVDPSAVETALLNSGSGATSGASGYGATDPSEEGRFVPGTLLGGRYRIIGLIGVGGMGEVYRATDLTLGQSVALKFLPVEAASNQHLLERFHGEVRVARQVSHPNVCRVYDIGQIEGMPFIAMEYVDGEDLASLLHRIGRLPGDKAIETARKICAGLAAAHDKGVIHRDLKPHNIMMNKRGEVLIMDFGLAAIADQLTGAEVRNGTPAYMSPEQLRGSGVTARSDIYSLGLVLYELFTGKQPYEGKSIQHLLAQQEAANLPNMSSIAADVDPAVDSAVRQCLEPDPARRPASALAVSAALPGGDPLAAALAAGETPSPELVASAGATQGLARRYSIPCLLLVILCLFGSTLVRERTSALMHVDLDYSPDVLAVKSRGIAELLGYPRKPGDSALWLDHRGRLLAHLQSLPEPHKWEEWLASEAPILSFYREAPRSLDAEPFGYVTRDNPPPMFPGMVQVNLDGQGRLREFAAAPYGTPENLEKPVQPDVVFRAAGLDLNTFTEMTPVSVPLHASDTFRAWRGPHPKIPDTPLVVEIGSWKGRITHVQVAYPWMRAAGAPRPQRTFIEKFRGHLFLFITAVGFVFVALLARRNWKLGRTDRKGALRIATAKFVLGLIIWAGTVHAVPSEDMLFYFFHNAAEWFTVAAMIWLLYLALEPALRARWPRSIVTWNRILVGRWNDAQVGAHILLGATTGCGLWMIAQLLEMSLGDYALNTDNGLFFTLGARQWLAGHASTVSVAINISLIAFFCIFGLRMLLRKDILAAIAAAVLFTLNESRVINSPEWQWKAVMFVGIFAILIFVLLRLGLVATMAAVIFSNSFSAITLGGDWKTWYAPAGIATLLLLITIALLAFWRSLGSRDLLSGAPSS
jgi:predicted Ser/Thr protein kinase